MKPHRQVPRPKVRLKSSETRQVLTLRLPRETVQILDSFLHHSLDAAAGDNRPDHGLARMKAFWKHDETRGMICSVSVRLARWLRPPPTHKEWRAHRRKWLELLNNAGSYATKTR